MLVSGKSNTSKIGTREFCRQPFWNAAISFFPRAPKSCQLLSFLSEVYTSKQHGLIGILIQWTQGDGLNSSVITFLTDICFQDTLDVTGNISAAQRPLDRIRVLSHSDCTANIQLSKQGPSMEWTGSSLPCSGITQLGQKGQVFSPDSWKNAFSSKVTVLRTGSKEKGWQQLLLPHLLCSKNLRYIPSPHSVWVSKKSFRSKSNGFLPLKLLWRDF